LPYNNDEKVESSKEPDSWEITSEEMSGNVVIYEEDAVFYFVLRKEQKCLSKGVLVGTTECMTL